MDPWEYRAAADHGLKPDERWRSLQRESGLSEQLTQSAWRLLTRIYLKAYHRLKIEGLEHVPRGGPFILIGNHSSHLDALTLAAALPWSLRRFIFPIAAGDVFFQTPLVSSFSALMLNALPMWRRRCGSHALQELRDRLVQDGAIYILFPEGTRSRDGKMGPFKPGIGMMIGGSAVPVVPCYLEGAFEAFPPNTRWPRPGKIRMRIGPALRFEGLGNDRAGWQEIAIRSEEAVRRLAPNAGAASAPFTEQSAHEQTDAESKSGAEGSKE